MKSAYFDCVAGASGDMILGALIDAGLPLDTLKRRLTELHLNDFKLAARRVSKQLFAATQVDVVVANVVQERHLDEIVSIVSRSSLPPSIKERAIAIFQRIGTVEANIHGTSPEEVHLHELGGVDTIVDVVGALVGLQELGVERITVSPIPLARGFIVGAHGQIPLPAPATLALLRQAPIVGSDLNVETVTPTGAALLTSLADAYGPIPPMKLETVGYGAGRRDLPVPNVIRLLIGESEAATDSDRMHAHGITTHEHQHSASCGNSVEQEAEDAHREAQGHTHPEAPEQPLSTDAHHHQLQGERLSHDHDTASCLDVSRLSVLETNIDDLNPEVYDHVLDVLFAVGALDVFLAPIQMKKNRPATLLRVLCRPDDVETMTALLFRETSTLGVREHSVKRHALRRTVEQVDTVYGPVHVKVAHLGDGRIKSSPEHNDCRALATACNAPLREVYQAAHAEARRRFGG